MAGISDPAFALAHASDWTTFQPTTSNSAIASVSINGTPTITGSLTFTVDHLATAASVRSGSIYSSTSATAAADAGILLAKGAGSLGFSKLASNDALSVGNHTIQVTQASAAATKTGDGVLAGTTVIDGTNDALDVTSTASRNDSTSPMAPTASPASPERCRPRRAVFLTASVDPANRLVVATSREGSAATLQVTGGTALAALNFSTDVAALTGVDGKVTVDGVQNVLSSVDAGGTVSLARPPARCRRPSPAACGPVPSPRRTWRPATVR